ncbi:MAG: hypothetical protein R2819_04595 [Allomuricauda sp.]
MKKTYLIQTSIKNNEVFNNRIKSLGPWMRYFSDNWLVQSSLSAQDIYNLLSIGNEKESIFIIELNKSNYWGRMNTEVWDYLKKN